MSKKYNPNLWANFDNTGTEANPEVIKTSIKNHKVLKKENINISPIFSIKKEKENIIYKGIYFKQENWDYIKKISKETGMSNSQIVNKVFSYFIEKNS
ncbi:MAG: hypothetical protein PPFGHCPK_01485 (plasmid) [Spiroplasma endosymbiont of Drosophila atripex]|nr:MAG: hypothetical protein PPFGHCPK_01485 [Spiroplasma endosymbiont of Drosophila atripex]